jgi:hypothetical protein
MNDEVTIFQAMIQFILQLTLQCLLIHTCQKPLFEGDVFSEHIF